MTIAEGPGPRSEPGFDCPVCGAHVRADVNALLGRGELVCGGCGLVLQLDHSKSSGGLDELRRLLVGHAEAQRRRGGRWGVS